MHKSKLLLVTLFCLLLLVPTSLALQTNPQSSNTLDFPTSQIIIQFSDTAVAQTMLAAATPQTQLEALSQVAGVELQYLRAMSGDAHVLKLPEALPQSDVASIANKLADVPGVAYAEPDAIRMAIGNPAQEGIVIPAAAPNDPQFANQWHYKYVANTSEGINVVQAWDKSTGSGVVVAVIDTGILNHADLAGQTVAGYDFIGDTFVANDGNGRDNNPADPGDWTSPNACYAGWPGSNSSWHGTHVAGTIAAKTNNNAGVAGVAYNAKILPVRVLGRCGGFTSDIVDGIRWSAGISVSGVPNNANPANVINMSLGGSGACSSTEQNAINAAVNAGTTVVVAAGNENQNASNSSPANCNNVITVAATDRTGDRAFYSNYGNVVKVSAPGGETTTAANGILSTLNNGTTSPTSDAYVYYQGTSMATPHVAGVAALIKALHPSYTPTQILQTLQITARPFPGGSSCNTSNCGAGIIDAKAALNSNPLPSDYQLYLPLVFNSYSSAGLPLLNGNFEGTGGWTEYSAQGWDIITHEDDINGVNARSGSYLAWLGGDNNETSYIQQQVTVPASTPYLIYYNIIGSNETQCNKDAAGVLVNGTVVSAYGLCSATNTGTTWTKRSVNLSGYAGQTVMIQIRVETDGATLSGLLVDDVSFAATAAANSSPTTPATTFIMQQKGN